MIKGCCICTWRASKILCQSSWKSCLVTIRVSSQQIYLTLFSPVSTPLIKVARYQAWRFFRLRNSWRKRLKMIFRFGSLRRILDFSLLEKRGPSFIFTIKTVEQQAFEAFPSIQLKCQKKQGFLSSSISTPLESQENSFSCLSFFKSKWILQCRKSFERTFGTLKLAGPPPKSLPAKQL